MNIDKQEEFEWVQEEGIMESGAFDSFAGIGHIDPEDIRETSASRNAEKYWTACAGTVTNKGEVSMETKSQEGIPVDLKVQVGDKISTILIAVRNAVEAGNMVVFGADQKALKELSNMKNIDKHFVYGKKTGIKTQIHDKDGMYKYPMWVKRRIRSESVNHVPESESSGWREPNKRGKISWGDEKQIKVVSPTNDQECEICDGNLEWNETLWRPFMGQA